MMMFVSYKWLQEYVDITWINSRGFSRKNYEKLVLK